MKYSSRVHNGYEHCCSCYKYVTTEIYSDVVCYVEKYVCDTASVPIDRRGHSDVIGLMHVPRTALDPAEGAYDAPTNP